MAEEIPLETAGTQANPVSNGTGSPDNVSSSLPTETPTAQRVEPLDSVPVSPPPAPELSVSTPTPVSIPVPVISRPDSRSLFAKAREVIQFRKRKKLEKIMGLFLKRQSISNDDVEKLLHVSDATATRYLEQLEKEGKIRQTGTGKAISYSRV